MHTTQHTHTILIVGGGPTGLMLAAELKLAGVDVALIERRADQHLDGTRAGGLHAHTLELLELRGLAQRFIAQGQVMQIAGFAFIPLDISDLPSRHPYGLALPQQPIERTLAAWADELGVTIYRSREVVDLTQDEASVTVTLADGATMQAAYLVGCDGGRSLERGLAGIAFEGWDASVSYLIAEARLSGEPPWGIQRGERGVNALRKMGAAGEAAMVLIEDAVRQGEPSLEELRAALRAVYGDDFGVCDVTWASRFSDAARQAATYRANRVLVAGDAAHIHSPAGGQGLNLGVQDAMNLGWKLALVARGEAPDSLLDSYHAERHPVVARVLKNTLAQTALSRGDARTLALHEALSGLLKLDAPRQRYGAMMSGLDLCYGSGEGHPLLGRRLPDLDLVTPDGPRRASSLLHQGRPTLLALGEASGLDVGPWAGRVQTIRADTSDPWALPVVGAIPAPQAVLIRPDGYVAWVGEGTDEGLVEALTRWFGPM